MAIDLSGFSPEAQAAIRATMETASEAAPGGIALSPSASGAAIAELCQRVKALEDRLEAHHGIMLKFFRSHFPAG